MDTIRVLDKSFREFIGRDEIARRVKDMGEKISTELEGKELLFIGVLNGSFMFAADLYRKIELPSQISFLKLSSYDGMESTGNVRRLIGLNEDLRGKTVVVIEDIIDSGRTLQGIISDLNERGADNIKVATLLFKPDAYKGTYDIDYIGFEIPNDFVVGYGLDYDGFGRNLPSIYTLDI
ncbi:MAG: hypoxanthine phosphoribosyltransferase [Bacteroidales bacterium]|nr:hypoxanthine phosphoribosyltransferase [Bacteroidales bacterium]